MIVTLFSFRHTIVKYELCFDDDANNGFAFPCNQNGKLEEMTKAAKENYNYCLNHKDEFVRYNEVVKIATDENSEYGICDCGEKVELKDEYLGACQCKRCGQWYNLFGEELLPPGKWGKDSDY